MNVYKLSIPKNNASLLNNPRCLVTHKSSQNYGEECPSSKRTDKNLFRGFP